MCGFLDNAKAFDRIWHEGLFYKLHKLGLTGKVWQLIKHNYSNSFSFVSHSGEISNVYPVKQGVGQGRVMSAWFFLVYINDLIAMLRSAQCGIYVYGQHMPAILLADDTTIISTSPSGLQRLLNIVNLYADKWRLTYNATKSKIVIFQKSKTVLSFEYSLGETALELFPSVTYGGILLTYNLLCKTRVDDYCRKARQHVNSLRPLGLNQSGLHPATCVKIWQRFVLKTSFYGCELLSNIHGKDIILLETTQRYFARCVQGMDKRSSTGSTIANLGLISMIGYIDQCKLQFIGSLFNMKCNTSPKHIFCAFIGTTNQDELNSKTICGDLVSVLYKYNLENYMYTYLQFGSFPVKSLWNKILRKAVFEKEECEWIHAVTLNTGLSRYRAIHSKLKLQEYWMLTYVYPKQKVQLQFCITVLSRAKISKECPLCIKHAYDYDKHIILHCESLLAQRNNFFNFLIDELDVDTYVRLEMQDEDDLICTLFGANNTFNQNIDIEMKHRIMITFALFVYLLKPHLQYIWL